MKAFTTMKAVREGFRYVFRCGYAELSNMGLEAWYYNSGIYGWNCDVFVSPSMDIAITSGYRNMTGKPLPAEILEHYRDASRNIPAFGGLEARNKLIDEFWNTVERYAKYHEITF